MGLSKNLNASGCIELKFSQFLFLHCTLECLICICAFYWLKWPSRSFSWRELESAVVWSWMRALMNKYVHLWPASLGAGVNKENNFSLSFFPSSLPHFLEVLFIHKSLASSRYCSIIAQKRKDQILVGEESFKCLANHNAYYKFACILSFYWLTQPLFLPPSFFLNEIAFVCKYYDLYTELAD